MNLVDSGIAGVDFGAIFLVYGRFVAIRARDVYRKVV